MRHRFMCFERDGECDCRDNKPWLFALFALGMFVVVVAKHLLIG